MALPSSGPISMSMVNIEIGDDFNQGVSFQSIASDFNLSAPNYGDSKLGLGLDELYGLSPSLTAVFSDFAVSSFNVDSQDGSITSQPTATAGSDPLVSLTIDYVGDPFSLVLADITRTADIDLTVPAESAGGNPYVNQGSTLSGQVTSTQNPYQFEFNDWTGGPISVNPNTGDVGFNNGNDTNAPSVVTNNTTFAQVSSSPGAGEYLPNNTSFGTFSNGSTTRTITFTLGVPDGSQNGSGGAYGNQGTTVSGTKTVTQFAAETIASNPTGSTTSGVDLLFAYNSTTNQTVTITVSGGNGSIDHDGTILSGHSSGGVSPSSDFYISTDSSFPVNNFSAGFSSGNGHPTGVYYVKPASTNSTITSKNARIIFSTNVGGQVATVLITQEGNVVFTTSPAGGSTIVFNSNGTLSSGDNSIDLTTSSGIDWNANVTGSGFSVTPSSGTNSSTVSVFAASNTGTGRSGTMNIDATTAGITGVLKTFTLSQKAAQITGTVKYNGANQSVSVGSFGTAITIANNGTTVGSGIPSPSFMDFRVHGTNYTGTYDVSISPSAYAGLSLTSNTSGTGQGNSTLSNISTTTSSSGNAQFFCNIDANDTQSTQTFTLTITFDDDSSTSTTTFDFTLSPIPGGGGPGGGDDDGPGGGGGIE